MRELYRDYFSLLGARRRRALVLVGLLTFSGLLEVAALTTLIPMLSPDSVVRSRHALVRSFVDGFSLDRRGVVAVALCAFVVLGLASAATKFGVEVALLRLRVRVEQSMRDEMTRAVTAMDWSAFHTMRLGDLTKALITEGYNASLGLQLLLLSTGAALISLVFLATALVISARLTAVTVLFAVVAATVYRRLSRRVDRYSSRLAILKARQSRPRRSAEPQGRQAPGPLVARPWLRLSRRLPFPPPTRLDHDHDSGR